MSDNLNPNDFVGNVKIIAKTNGDGIGFCFGDFTIWKNSNHRYFIKRNDGKYWCGKWSKNFYYHDKILVTMYNTFSEVLIQADRLFSIKKYEEKDIMSLENDYNRFDLMDFG